jgi:hypothetical protein
MVVRTEEEEEEVGGSTALHLQSDENRMEMEEEKGALYGLFK